MPGRWRVRRAARATTCPRRWGCSTRCSSSASRASCTTRLRLRSGPDGRRRVGPAVTAAGCRAARRGAPGPQGALRPLGPQGRASLSLRDQETLPRGRLPRSLRSRRPCPANGCIQSLAHGRDHSAVSRASGSHCGLPNAPSGSPSEALRSPSRWAGWIGNTYLDDSGRDSPASLNSTGDM